MTTTVRARSAGERLSTRVARYLVAHGILSAQRDGSTVTGVPGATLALHGRSGGGPSPARAIRLAESAAPGESVVVIWGGGSKLAGRVPEPDMLVAMRMSTYAALLGAAYGQEPNRFTKEDAQ